MPITPHATFIEDDDGNPTAQSGWIEPATPVDAQRLLALQPDEAGNTRSEFFWMRLHDGTLLLGTFPQGDTYCALETVCEWRNADGVEGRFPLNG